MTANLDSVIARLASLPEQEHDHIAEWILQELQDEELWDKQFSQTQDVLGILAAEALKEHTAGKTTPLDPDNF